MHEKMARFVFHTNINCFSIMTLPLPSPNFPSTFENKVILCILSYPGHEKVNAVLPQLR